MQHAQTLLEGPLPSSDPKNVLQHVALPLFLFAAVLLSLLTFSWVLLLPRITQMEVDGKTRDVVGLQSYAASLQEQIAEAEATRDGFVLPMDGTDYRALTDAKHANADLASIQDQVMHAGRALSAPDAVSLDYFQFNAATQTVTLTGDVRNVGPQSMTVLAEFVEALKVLPFVEELDPPSFTREEDPKIGLHSPFTITLHLL